MTDSTNPRVMADNIKKLVVGNLSQDAEIEALDDKIEALGSYSATEINTGMTLGNAVIYRKVFSLEGLPNATTDTIPHGISGIDKVINLYGVAQKTASYQGRMIPYSNLLGVQYDANNIYVTSSVDRSDVPAIIVIEYTKAVTPTPDILPAPDSDTRFLDEPEPEPIEEKK